MGDQHDSWLGGLGVDVGNFFDGAAKTVESTVSTVVQEAKGAVEQAQAAVTAAAKTVSNAAPSLGPKPAVPKAASAGDSGGTSSVSSLGGSVGQGGQNNPADVKAVQTALNSKAGAGLVVDGKCGGGTINAIKAFQKSMGQANPDGRVDAGGATSRALAGGGSAPAAAVAAVSVPAAEADGFSISGLVTDAKALGGKLLKQVEDEADAAKAFGGKVLKGAEDLAGEAKKLGGNLVDGAGGGTAGGATNDFGSAASKLLTPASGGTEVTFKERSLGKKKLGKFFEVEIKVSGSVKFGGAPEGPDKPSKIELKKGVLEFVASLWDEAVANFKAESSGGIKGNTTKDGKGLSLGGAVTLKTNLGPLNLEFAPIEISLVNFDPKKGLTGPKASASGSGNLAGKKTIKGVELELALAVTLGGELTPDYANIAEFVVEKVLTDAATQFIMEAGLILVAVGSVAGLARGLAIAVEEKQLRGELELARNRFGTGMVMALAGLAPPGDKWGNLGGQAGQKVFNEALARAKEKFPDMSEIDRRDIAIDACKPSTRIDGAVNAKIAEVVGAGFWTKWIDGHHGVTTFLGDAKRVCGTCFATGPVANNDPRLQEWKNRSELPNFFSEKTP
jgi:peptidoglycan hydrolase-like protein with peptidoglycan-binding domain